MQGQSLATIAKERRFGGALAIGMRIASHSKFTDRGYKYWHFDANAGSGWNQEYDVEGSPLVFWRTSDMWLRGMDPTPFFCDRDATHMQQLQQALGIYGARSILVPADNEEALVLFARCIDRDGDNRNFAIGSILIDPNGWFYRNAKGEGVPVRALSWFAERFPRIDLILNLNTRTYVLQKAQGHNVLAPTAVLASLNKQHWLVGHSSYGGSRFLTAIGRNVSSGDYKKVGLFLSTSDEGRSILNAAEGDRQASLGLDVSQLPRIPPASRIPGSARGGDAARS